MGKRPFLAVYDYAQGGVWAIVSARSERDIKARFPEFEIFDRPRRGCLTVIYRV